MKKVIAVIALVAFIVALPTSHFLMAKKGEKPAKVFVCHITGEGVVQNSNGVDKDAYIGHVIEVSANAVKAHCAHGDHGPVDGNKVIGNFCWRPVENTVAIDRLCGE